MKGYLSHEKVKAVVFWTVASSVVVATVSGCLLVWGTINEEAGSRILYTCLIAIAGSMAFMTVNFIFGNLGLFSTQGSPPTEMDSAFADRLRKAKEFRDPDKKAG